MKSPFHYFACSLYVLAVSLVIAFTYSLSATALKSSDIRNYLGTRTPYRFKYNKNESRIKYPNCTDTKIWMVVRHGTRLPSAKDILGMNTKLKDLKLEILLKNRKGKGPLNKVQLEGFTHWSNDIPVDQEKYLTLEGQDEMILLAERMQKRFPNAIKRKYNNKTFMFRYTATQRTQQSARFFTIGLFDKKDSQNVIFEPAHKVDTTLRFYKHCDRWQRDVKKNPETYKELLLFGKGKEMNDTLQSVSKRLGLDRVLPLDTVILMYKVCGYETSWRKYVPSPWCLAFDETTIQVLEYYHDLKHYWVDGYGHAQEAACVLLKDMFRSMRDGPDATFLFAHSGTLLKLLTLLELHRPAGHLRGDAVRPRAWRASDIDCFAANLAFVLLRCADGERLLALHQERAVPLPACAAPCPLQRLRAHFAPRLRRCDLAELCRLA